MSKGKCETPVHFISYKQKMEYDEQLQQKKPVTNVRDHLANERTFLARVHMGVVLMGFGFVFVSFPCSLNNCLLP